MSTITVTSANRGQTIASTPGTISSIRWTKAPARGTVRAYTALVDTGGIASKPLWAADLAQVFGHVVPGDTPSCWSNELMSGTIRFQELTLSHIGQGVELQIDVV
jgi:hypothetical protein